MSFLSAIGASASDWFTGAANDNASSDTTGASSATAANDNAGSSPFSFLGTMAESLIGGAGSMAGEALAAISSMWTDDEPAAAAPAGAPSAPSAYGPGGGGGGGGSYSGGAKGGPDLPEGPADKAGGGGGRRGGGGGGRSAHGKRAGAGAAHGGGGGAGAGAGGDGGGGAGAGAGGGAGAGAGVPGGGAPPPATGDLSPSGAEWRSKADANGWSNSTDLGDLDPSFGAKAKTFIDGLVSSGAHVSVTAGLRHPLRANLMHYAWDVADGSVSPGEANDACQSLGIPIDWDHGDAGETKAAASALSSAFSLVAEPSLTSNHISGQAVDMNITGVPAVLNVAGKTYQAGEKGSGTLDEDKVDHIGKDVGVIWYGSGDHVHWSVNGR